MAEEKQTVPAQSESQAKKKGKKLNGKAFKLCVYIFAAWGVVSAVVGIATLCLTFAGILPSASLSSENETLTPVVDSGKASCLKKAIEYVSDNPLSKEMLKQWLEDEGFSDLDISYVIYSGAIDFNENAVRRARDLREKYGWSKNLIKTMLYDNYEFTYSQSEYGANSADLWN